MTALLSSPTEQPGALSAGVAAARSEWIKLRSVRSTFWSVLAALVSTVGIAALVGHETARNAVHWGAEQRATYDATNNSLAGLAIGQLAIGVIGVLVMTSEFSSGMIRTTFAAVPRRRTVFAAKLAILGGAALLVGEFISFLAFGVGQAFMGRGVGASLTDPHVLRAVTGAGLYVTVVALVGLAFGTIIRHTAGALAALFGAIFVGPLLLGAFPQSWQHAISPWLLPSSGSGLASTMPPGNTSFGPGGSLGVCLLWAGVALAVASWQLGRRDA